SKGPVLKKGAKTVSAVMGGAYPELRAEEQRIREIIRMEEERFGETLERGLVLLEEETAKLKPEKNPTLNGNIAFRLYDTYGFPLDLTEDILRTEGIAVDQAEFEKLMAKQLTRGREAREVPTMESKIQLDQPICFIGYDQLQAESSVLGIYGGNGGQPEAVEGDELYLLTAETPFYGESGGQVGDRGTITTARGDVIEVFDTQHPTPQLIAHRGRDKTGRVSIAD